MESCYRILGVEPGTPRETVLSKFRALARGCHPDTGPHDPSTLKTYYKIIAAWATWLRLNRKPVNPDGVPDDTVSFADKLARFSLNGNHVLADQRLTAFLFLLNDVFSNPQPGLCHLVREEFRKKKGYAARVDISEFGLEMPDNEEVVRTLLVWLSNKSVELPEGFLSCFLSAAVTESGARFEGLSKIIRAAVDKKPACLTTVVNEELDGFAALTCSDSQRALVDFVVDNKIRGDGQSDCKRGFLPPCIRRFFSVGRHSTLSR